MGTIQEHTQVIDGRTYTTKTLPASDGIRILPRLVALLGDGLIGLLLTAEESEREALLSDPKVLAAVISGISQVAAETNGFAVVKDLLKSTTCEQVQIGDAEVPGSVHTHFDTHFAGRYRHLADVAMWVGRVNFFGP